MELSQGDFDRFTGMGYSDAEILEAIKDVEREELNNSYKQTQQIRYNEDPRYRSQMSSFTGRPEDNIAKWQLDLNEILERIEHILKNDVPTFENGNMIWKVNSNPENNTLSAVGIQEIMKILALYVNKNKVLADYTNEEINFKVYDFGRAVNNLLFMRDIDFGMDDSEKRKNYEMIVTELKDVVHDTYKRALNGAEKRSLREMIQVSQNTNTQATLGQGTGVTINNQGMPQRERGLLNPMRFIKGRYL